MSRVDSNQIAVLFVGSTENFEPVTRLFGGMPGSMFVVDLLADANTALPVVSKHDYDVYLVDGNLSEPSALEFLAIIRPERMPEPFLVIASRADRSSEHQALKAGAADYLASGSTTPESLERALRFALDRKRFEQQRWEHLVEMNRAKDEFIALASHQLRTPATAVKQYISMVLEGIGGSLTPSQVNLLRKADMNNERQLATIADLLRVAKVDSGQIRLKLQPLDIASLLQQTVDNYRPVYRRRGQKLRYVAAAKPVLVADGDLIKTAVENLLDNASKYSHGATTTSLRLGHSDNQATIIIEDQGVGIAPEDQTKLFEKFSRIYNPLSHRTEGTGLGLYWVKRVVSLHGGSIEVESALNKGTKFLIHLPETGPEVMLKS